MSVAATREPNAPSAQEDARLKQIRDDCRRLMPDFVVFLKDLCALGMAEGWRSVAWVRELTPEQKARRRHKARRPERKP